MRRRSRNPLLRKSTQVDGLDNDACCPRRGVFTLFLKSCSEIWARLIPSTRSPAEVKAPSDNGLEFCVGSPIRLVKISEPRKHVA